MATSIWLFVIPFAMAAAMPGPAQAALVGRVLAVGPRHSVPFALGMVGGTAVWLCFAALGVAVIAARFSAVFYLLKWLGVVYLLWVAWSLWNASPAPVAPSTPASSSARSAAGDLALTLGNPKAVLFFGAVLPTAFDLADLTVISFLGILALGIAIDAAVQTAYVLLAGRARRLVRSAVAIRRTNRGAAALMAGSPAVIATRQ